MLDPHAFRRIEANVLRAQLLRQKGPSSPSTYRSVRVLFFLSAVLISSPDRVQGALPAHMSRAIKSGNGQYVLVLLRPSSIRINAPIGDAIASAPGQEDERVALSQQRAIEEAYPSSGLYRADSRSHPLWPVKYIDPSWTVDVANDGRHVVAARLMRDGNSTPASSTLQFFVDGHVLKTYADDDLINGFIVKLLASRFLHLQEPGLAEIAVDNERDAIVIRTTQGEIIEMDLSSGQVRSRWSPWPIYLSVSLVLVPVASWRLSRSKISLRPRTAAKRKWAYSLRGLLTTTFVICCVIASIKVWTWKAACAIVIAVIGAISAFVIAPSRFALALGGILALNGVAVSGTILAGVDEITTLLQLDERYWWLQGWGVMFPVVLILLTSILGGVVAGVLCRTGQSHLTRTRRIVAS